MLEPIESGHGGNRWEYALYLLGLVGAGIAPYARAVWAHFFPPADRAVDMAQATIDRDEMERKRLIAIIERREARIDRLVDQLARAGKVPVE